MRLCHGWWWRAARLLIPRISMRVEYRSVSIHDRATWKPSLVSSAPVIRFASSCACFLPDDLSRFNCCAKGGIYRFPSGSMESSFLFFIYLSILLIFARFNKSILLRISWDLTSQRIIFWSSVLYIKLKDRVMMINNHRFGGKVDFWRRKSQILHL